MQRFPRKDFFSLARLLIVSCFILFGTQLIEAQETNSPCKNRNRRANQTVCLNSSQTKELATKKVAPVFPKSCRCFGEIVVYVKVNEEGELISVFAKKGHPLLRIASVEAVKEWKFKAYQQNKKNRGFFGRIDFLFSSNGDVRF